MSDETKQNAEALVGLSHEEMIQVQGGTGPGDTLSDSEAETSEAGTAIQIPIKIKHGL